MEKSVPDDVFEEIISQLTPYTSAEGEIERIRFERSLSNSFSIQAYVEEPWPQVEFPDDSPQTGFAKPLDKDAFPENESVKLRGESKRWMQTTLLEAFEETFHSVPKEMNIQFETGIIESNREISFVFSVNRTVRPESFYTRLGDVLTECEYIDSPEEFAYGKIEKYGDTIDGTLYKWVTDPWNVWKEPDNEEEWIDFASDSDADKERLQNQEQYLIHFHPHEIEEFSDTYDTLNQWVLDAEDRLFEDMEITTGESYIMSAIVEPEVLVLSGTVAVSGSN